MAPEGVKNTRGLYYRHPNGWVYLTRHGRQVYEENRAEVDCLIKDRHESRREAWAEQAAARVMAALVR